MKSVLVKVSILGILVTASASAVAQAGGMQGMDMNNTDMKGMKMDSQPHEVVHEAKGVVKQLDTAGGLVTIAHGPVATLKWQAMTMTFKVKDNTLLDKIEVGKAVRFSFVQQGGDYVVTRIK